MKRFLHALAAAIVVLITAQAAPALAITIEVVVNGVPITSYDIEQRIKLLDALGANGDLASSRSSSSPRIESRSRPPGSSGSSFPRARSTRASTNSPPGAA